MKKIISIKFVTMPIKANYLRQVEEPAPPPAPRRSYVPPVYKENENYDDRLGGFI